MRLRLRSFWVLGAAICMVILLISNIEEGFTPRIRQTYRPMIRTVRLGIENVYTQWSNYIKTKFGRYF